MTSLGVEVCAGTTAWLEVADRHTSSVLAGLLRLIGDGPFNGLLGLAQPWWASDEQPSNALPVVSPEPPEEEPLDDLAQPVLRLLRRE